MKAMSKTINIIQNICNTPNKLLEALIEANPHMYRFKPSYSTTFGLWRKPANPSLIVPDS